MSLPLYIPALSINPVGWAILGAASVLTYKAGKKAGLKSQDDVEKPGLGDRAIKCSMKTFYRVKKSAEETFYKNSEKYSAMWQEARSEVKTRE